MESFNRSLPAEVIFREDGVAILESHHEEGFKMDWRRDSFPKVLFVVGGEGVLHCRFSEYAIRAPSLVVVPEGERHRLSDAKANPMSLYGMCFKDTMFPSGSLIDASCGKWRVENATNLAIEAAELLKAIMIEERSGFGGSEALQLSYICQLLVAITRSSRSGVSEETLSSQSRVAAYAERLTSSFWKSEGLDSVALSLGLSRRRFTQVFREVTGESWLARITRLRMSHAARLLKETDLSIRSISFECGAVELSSFYRIFKKNFGQSPGEYRKGFNSEP